ncbi:CaiB/BaiF CoA transferase family protein [Gordonia sp. DT30]
MDGVTVLEVSQYGPDALGGHLADLGASVIKIEAPDVGDPVRFSGPYAVGGPNGVGFLHLRWNRGKRSITLDLGSPGGVASFKELAADAQVVIEGMRAGVLERLGLGYDELRKVNPRLVFCSLSGLGSWGDYHTQGSHGPSYDGFGGLLKRADGSLPESPGTPVGMYAMGLYAALATTAAVRRAERTGLGAMVEIAAADCAAHWLPTGVDPGLNADSIVARPGFASDDGKMTYWPRLTPYETSDGRTIMFQAIKEKYWLRFCDVVDRPDLIEIYASADEVGEADRTVHAQLIEFFAQRRYVDLMKVFLANDIPALPVNSHAELATDPHFLARDNIYEVEGPGGEPLRLTGTPIKVRGQGFSPHLAPMLGADTTTILNNRAQSEHA